MKCVGFNSLPEMLRASENATVYMLSTSQEYGQQIQWIKYQIMIQCECGENVHYWLLDLGAEPVGMERRSESKSHIADEAEAAIRAYLQTRGIKPHAALIAFPKDLSLLAGGTSDFMHWNAERKTFEYNAFS